MEAQSVMMGGGRRHFDQYISSPESVNEFSFKAMADHISHGGNAEKVDKSLDYLIGQLYRNTGNGPENAISTGRADAFT
jgi:hypothetical protein